MRLSARMVFVHRCTITLPWSIGFLLLVLSWCQQFVNNWSKIVKRLTIFGLPGSEVMANHNHTLHKNKIHI